MIKGFTRKITVHDFHWRDTDKPSTIKAVEVLNTLTQEQLEAVELYAESRRDEGYDQGAGEVLEG